MSPTLPRRPRSCKRRPKARKDSNKADRLFARLLALPHAQRCQFYEALAGSRVVANDGWRLSERQLSSERFPERNHAMRRLNARGLSYAQIGRLFGVSRYAVRNVIKRGERSVNAKATFTPTNGYDSTRRKKYDRADKHS